eukprot:TRINITY_DN52525_c0_g2_i1.p2 TRINITY_DN52525_c0_g2~~TRINITY_DN52525_c0_g2_i1.p2  ORF type:complete len:149 (-),score=20.02 TRINITY_DN52525_c0_g2_i1:152-598(-)
MCIRDSLEARAACAVEVLRHLTPHAEPVVDENMDFKDWLMSIQRADPLEVSKPVDPRERITVHAPRAALERRGTARVGERSRIPMGRVLCTKRLWKQGSEPAEVEDAPETVKLNARARINRPSPAVFCDAVTRKVILPRPRYREVLHW